MRLVCLLLVLLGISAEVLAQADAATLLSQASAAYVNHDFETARSIYEALAQSGITDPALHFNLGNTYYQLGDLGHALLNYRKAYQFWPRDTNVSENLLRVRSERVDILGDETGLIENFASFTEGILTLFELTLLEGLLWAIWLGLLCATIWRPAWYQVLRYALVIFGVGVLLGGFLLGCRIYTTVFRPTGVVVAAAVQVRSGPGESYLELYTLHAAAELHLREINNGWAQFELPDGRLGWLPLDAVK